MKISKLFHWLYASIMFLPLLVAPIFAIYSHRHTIDSYEVTRDKYQVVDFNQLLQNNHSPFINEEHWTQSANVISYLSSGNIVVTFSPSSDTAEFYLQTNVPRVDGHKYLYNCIYYSYQSSSDLYARCYVNNSEYANTLLSAGQNTFEKIIIANGSTPDSNFGFICPNGTPTELKVAFSTVNLFDLTQMFGEGNEPTIEQFNTWYPNYYYDYTLSKKELLNIGTETLNNTDIGSQFVYAIYNPLNDYFNFNKFLGIGNLYNWMQLNLFKGTAPLGFFIFWELLMYWLLISLIWLIFDVAMYVPKLAHRWLDKASLE